MYGRALAIAVAVRIDPADFPTILAEKNSQRQGGAIHWREHDAAAAVAHDSSRNRGFAGRQSVGHRHHSANASLLERGRGQSARLLQIPLDHGDSELATNCVHLIDRIRRTRSATGQHTHRSTEGCGCQASPEWSTA